jgi:hypothetical protein
MAQDSDVDRIVILSDKTQEWIIEHVLWPSRPTNWPPCPDHPDTHPLDAKTWETTAAWACPTDKFRVSDIGSLAPPVL